MSTVCAIATPPAVGGISVIRISGENALDIAAAVFKPVSGADIKSMRGYTAAYGRIFDGKERIDDGVLLVYKAPHSYTGEDTAEISCHGGIYVTRRVLTSCIKAGAEPAAAGEFTKRAVLNGKMSLTQAEAVADIIGAQGAQLLACSNSQREGALYKRTEKISEKLLAVLAQISAWIDFPEDDTPVVTSEWLDQELSGIKSEFDSLLSDYDAGRVIRDGVSVAIVGKPNAGKSTIMNLLTGTRRSIVSDIAGTTRDIVEETVNLSGLVLRLSDCAGLRDTADEVEKIGVELMLQRLRDADLALAVFDGSVPLSDEDNELIERLSRFQSNVLCVINKRDLKPAFDGSELEQHFGDVVRISAKELSSADILAAAIEKRVQPQRLDPNAGFLANERQRLCVIKAADAVENALGAVSSGVTPDAVGVMLEQALDAVYELSGKRAGDEVISDVFKRFCVGK